MHGAPPSAKSAGPPAKTQPFVYVVAFMAVIGGFLFGYDCGVVAGAMLTIRDVWHDVDDLWHELIVSVTVAAAAIFSLVGSLFNRYFGRKITIIISSVLFAIGAVILGVSPNKSILLVGRIVLGSAIGLSSMTVPAYVAEASPPHIRGRLVTLFQLQITFGFFFSAVVNGLIDTWVKDKEVAWRLMFGVAGIPAVIQGVGFLFMPESPRWLAESGKTDQAYKVLLRLTGSEEIARTELDEISAAREESILERQKLGDRNVLVSMLVDPPVRKALIVGCLLQLFQQLCGINTVMYYSASIVKMGGMTSTQAAVWFTALTTGVNFLFTFPGMYLIEKLGRRNLLKLSMTGVILSLCLLGVSFILIGQNAPKVMGGVSGTDKCHKDINSCDQCSYHADCGFCYFNNGSKEGECMKIDDDDSSFSLNGTTCSKALIEHEGDWIFAQGYCPSKYAFLPILGMVVYLVSFSSGFGPIPWTVNAEIYPQWCRSEGNAIATAFNWGFNLLIALTFLSLATAITRQGAFFLYAGITSVGFVIFHFIVPETKGRQLDEIEQIFDRPWTELRKDLKTHRVVHPAEFTPTPTAAFGDSSVNELNSESKDEFRF